MAKHVIFFGKSEMLLHVNVHIVTGSVGTPTKNEKLALTPRTVLKGTQRVHRVKNISECRFYPAQSAMCDICTDHEAKVRPPGPE